MSQVLDVQLLGKFDVRHDGKSIAITSRPAQSLFAYLILNAGTAHRREKLAGLLWPDSLEETARDNLRHALWRLRKALNSASVAQFLHADDLTIKFESSPDIWLDTAKLESLSEHAGSDELIAVLSNYQGELLPGFYEEWVVLEREHLYSMFEHHMARLLSVLEDEGRWLDILDWAERWIKLGQKPEPAYRALMSAHAAKGDLSKVVATFERCTTSLAEFGIGPSLQTRALYEKLKDGKELLESGSTVPVKEKRKAVPKTNLPIPLTSFIGREKEITEIVRLLDKHRLVTLTGPGGVGKTRLAIQSSNAFLSKFTDGVWWVELAPLTDDRLVLQAVAHVLGVRPAPNRPLTEALKSFLSEKQLLVVLDNCEHLIAASAQFAFDHLTQCANLRILATSREPLGVTGEMVYGVPGLSLPSLKSLTLTDLLLDYEGIRLFVDRASSVKPGFALTEQNAAAILQICQRLDGISLALELAAARTRLLTVEEIADRLDDRFHLLTQGSRTALPRQQTLRAAMDWSYELLSESEKMLFRRLAVFTGGFTLEAAQTVCSGTGVDSDEILDLLAHLVEKSLVTVQEQDSEIRYDVLETIREYMRDKLSESGDHHTVQAQHTSFFMKLAARAEPELRGPNQTLWSVRLNQDIDNFRSVLARLLESSRDLAAQLAGSLLWFWHIRCYWSEGRDWFAQLLADEGGQSLSALANARALAQAGWLAYDEMDNDQAVLLSERALILCRELDEKPGAAMALIVRGWAAHNVGDQARARVLGEESLALYQQAGLTWGVADAFNLLGNVARVQGDFESAAEFYTGSLGCSREIGDVAGIAYSLLMSGGLAWYQGELERAAILTEESLTLSREIGLEWNAAAALSTLGDVARAQGNYTRASAFYNECESLWERLGNQRERGALIWSQGWLAILQRNYEEAIRRFRQGLLLWQDVHDRRRIAECLEGLGSVAAALGNAERAARLFGAAEMLREVTQSLLTPVESEAYKSSVAAVRAQLGKAAFENAWAGGRSMTLEGSIRFALKASGE